MTIKSALLVLSSGLFTGGLTANNHLPVPEPHLSAHPAPGTLTTTAANLAAAAPATYWQQEVHYDIQVSLNDKDNTLKGSETLQYTNHSPDTLAFIWFHLWPNAYQDKTTALYQQLSQLKERKNKLKKIKDNGYIDGLGLTILQSD